MFAIYSDSEIQFNNELKNIEKTTPNPLERYDKMAKIAIESYHNLKQSLKQHQFPDHESEIFFFKNIHPQAISKVHYYNLLHNCISNTCSLLTIKEKKYHCKKLLKQIKLYSSDFQHIITYYKSGKCNLDEKYFLRKNSDYPFFLEDCIALIDKDTSTGYDLIIARYLAYSQFSIYLQNENHLSESESIIPHYTPCGGFIKWLGSPTELIELMYALYAVGSIENNQMKITDIVPQIEKMFGVVLKDYYGTFSDFKYRKNQTLYIDNLRKALIQKIEKKDI